MGDFYVEKKVKARKLHRCTWCKCEIKKDEYYFSVANVFYGDFSSRKECEFCNK